MTINTKQCGHNERDSHPRSVISLSRKNPDRLESTRSEGHRHADINLTQNGGDRRITIKAAADRIEDDPWAARHWKAAPP